MSVLWIGANENQDRGGFVQGLEQSFDDVQLLRTPDGEYGIRLTSRNGKHRNRRDHWLRQLNRDRLLGEFRKWTPKHQRRIVFGQLWSKHLEWQVLDEMRNAGCVVVVHSMDDRHPMLWTPIERHTLGTVGLDRGVDLVATTVESAVRWYHVEGVPALHLPFGANPNRPTVSTPWHQRPIDVSFVGKAYGYRNKIVADLLEQGITVEAYGPGWPRGPVDAQQLAEVNRQSKIILGVSTVGYSHRVRTPKLRDLEALGSGAVYLNLGATYMPVGTEAGTHYLTYENADDCATTIRRVLLDQEFGAKIAESATQFVQTSGSWVRHLDMLRAHIVDAASA